MIFTSTGYDQHEAHCTFTSIALGKKAWKINAACLVEGNKQPDSFQLKVAANTLVLARGRAKQKLIRCL